MYTHYGGLITDELANTIIAAITHIISTNKKVITFELQEWVTSVAGMLACYRWCVIGDVYTVMSCTVGK